jgi:hypothetical protein
VILVRILGYFEERHTNEWMNERVSKGVGLVCPLQCDHRWSVVHPPVSALQQPYTSNEL